MPRVVRLRLEKIQRDFLWGGGALEKRPHLVKWDVVRSLKKKGGLGIRKFSILNRALLCKWSWCFAVERESFWELIISRKYGEEGGGWISREVREGYGVGFWKEIRKEGFLMFQNVSFAVGDGRRVKFWKDIWCGNIPLCEAFPSLFAFAVSQDAWVADCWDSIRDAGGWYPCFSRPFNDWEMEAEVSLLSLLQGKRLFVEMEDRVLWNASKNEIFSVKSLYNTLDSSGAVLFPWRIIWSPCVPTKAGARVNIIAGGATPLHIAADIGSPEIINCLLKAGADPNVTDEPGVPCTLACTPLSVRLGHMGILGRPSSVEDGVEVGLGGADVGNPFVLWLKEGDQRTICFDKIAAQRTELGDKQLGLVTTGSSTSDEPNLVWSSEKGRVEDINNHPINILGGLYAILITLRVERALVAAHKGHGALIGSIVEEEEVAPDLLRVILVDGRALGCLRVHYLGMPTEDLEGGRFEASLKRMKGRKEQKEKETKIQEMSIRIVQSLSVVRGLEWGVVNLRRVVGGVLVFWDNRFYKGLWPYVEERKGRFLGELGAIRGLWSDPWCMTNNFNLIKFSTKRSRGGSLPSTMRRFSKVIEDLELRDLPL
ncbi:putative ribonuclease H protein [Vitis vinifera]|uniref:Putative ribonuclease H protein n=1 Tax=Vitis vinifera TaxID=29760 RepID=A0A438IGV5_VITVI|nr:putative ribonuclease H protein [Vitis vinifera]